LTLHESDLQVHLGLQDLRLHQETCCTRQVARILLMHRTASFRVWQQRPGSFSVFRTRPHACRYVLFKCEWTRSNSETFESHHLDSRTCCCAVSLRNPRRLANSRFRRMMQERKSAGASLDVKRCRQKREQPLRNGIRLDRQAA